MQPGTLSEPSSELPRGGRGVGGKRGVQTQARRPEFRSEGSPTLRVQRERMEKVVKTSEKDMKKGVT